jgi:hypothetical protein
VAASRSSAVLDGAAISRLSSARRTAYRATTYLASAAVGDDLALLRRQTFSSGAEPGDRGLTIGRIPERARLTLLETIIVVV